MEESHLLQVAEIEKGIKEYEENKFGPGNIIGVTGAISLGGPGAMFWMWISALLGMASSFVEATLAQIFKEKDGDEYVGGLLCRFYLITAVTVSFQFILKRLDLVSSSLAVHIIYLI